MKTSLMNLDIEISKLEKRISLWRELTDLLAEAQSAVLRSDLQRIEALTTRQREVCHRLAEMKTGHEHPANPDLKPILFESQAGEDQSSQSAHRRLAALVVETRQIETQVGKLNQVYGGLIRRARRTADIYCRAIASSAMTYKPLLEIPKVPDRGPRQLTHV